MEMKATCTYVAETSAFLPKAFYLYNKHRMRGEKIDGKIEVIYSYQAVFPTRNWIQNSSFIHVTKTGSVSLSLCTLVFLSIRELLAIGDVTRDHYMEVASICCER